MERQRAAELSNRLYLALSGTIFLLVAFLHLARLIYDWPIVVGPRLVPSALSYVGCSGGDRPRAVGLVAVAAMSGPSPPLSPAALE